MDNDLNKALFDGATSEIEKHGALIFYKDGTFKVVLDGDEPATPETECAWLIPSKYLEPIAQIMDENKKLWDAIEQIKGSNAYDLIQYALDASNRKPQTVRKDRTRRRRHR